jgi:hypothetical protein
LPFRSGFRIVHEGPLLRSAGTWTFSYFYPRLRCGLHSVAASRLDLADFVPRRRAQFLTR